MPEPSEIVIDARGHRCPTPTLLLQRAIGRAPAGAVVVLLADDPMVGIDAPHFAREAGHEVIAVETEAAWLRIRVRKAG
jgi:tRNA 2-thiouridine synthesizing protein A